MTFDRIHECLWAVRWENEEDNEVGRLFDQWNDVSFLREFFKKYASVLTDYFHTTVSEAIIDTLEDAEYLETQILDLPTCEDMDSLFEPLGLTDSRVYSLQRNKAKNRTRRNHDSWLRIYALKLNNGHYVITGGVLKMARKMQDTPESNQELQKIDQCRAYLRSLGIIDSDGLNDFMAEN